MPTINGQTPLARLLAARGLTQQALAKLVGCGQASVSRLVNGKTSDPALAYRVVDVLDPARQHFNELFLLYPERFPDWQPWDQTASVPSESQG